MEEQKKSNTTKASEVKKITLKEKIENYLQKKT